MKRIAQIYRTNGTIEPYPEPANSTAYSLQELKAAIGGGWIEIAHLSDGRLMVFDEEGKLKDLPPNTVATLLWRQDRPGATDFIVGDALVCEESQID